MNVTTALEKQMALFISSAKIREHEGTSHHLAFMGKLSTISHTFLALATQWVSSPSRE